MTIPDTPTPVDDFPRDEAARLVQASLRPSLFLVLTPEGDIREYGIRFPDSVPLYDWRENPRVVEIMEVDMSMGASGRDIDPADIYELLAHMLPDGGVICVPPPDHRLCTRCRVGVRARRTPDDQELCESCAMAFTQASGVGTVAIGDGQRTSDEVGDEVGDED